ncbi:hypothetical protein EYF80_001681 [Liparis tanakae]|uniref:Uncharacterized protein n=1 Tax=Liparis tanakae TaxID=230148 RepID=A0A4Z2JD60_9TELE|nr:hypothetical protein EYF80_001681 [Liparis tanakae]
MQHFPPLPLELLDPLFLLLGSLRVPLLQQPGRRTTERRGQEGKAETRSWVLLAVSSSSLYSSSSHSLCSVLSGSLSCTGMATLDRSLPMLFLRMFHRLTLLVGLGEGSVERRRGTVSALLTGGEEFEIRRRRVGEIIGVQSRLGGNTDVVASKGGTNGL